MEELQSFPAGEIREGYKSITEICHEYGAPCTLVEALMREYQYWDVNRMMLDSEKSTYHESEREKKEHRERLIPTYANLEYAYDCIDPYCRLHVIMREIESYGFVSREKEAGRLKKEAIQKLLDTGNITAEQIGKTQSRVFSLDEKTDVICGGHITGTAVEQAMLKYSEHPAENVTEEKTKLPLSKKRKSHTITMSDASYALLDKLCAGQKIAATIIEVALWRNKS